MAVAVKVGVGVLVAVFVAVFVAVLVGVFVDVCVGVRVGVAVGVATPHEGNLNEPTRVTQFCPCTGKYSVVYQNVQSSVESIFIEV